MSDSGTDSFVGVVIVLVAIVAVVASVNGNALGDTNRSPAAPSTRTATTRPSSSGSPVRASTNIPAGPLLSCPGTVISNKSAGSGQAALNLKVYYSAAAGGRNCAVVTKLGATTRRKGQVVISLRFADSTSTRWPNFAEHRSSATATRSGSVYLDNTDNRCVRAQARFAPADGGRPVSVSSGRTGCG